MRIVRIVLLLLLTAAFVTGEALIGDLAAAPTAEQTQKLKAADAALRKAGADFTAGKFKEAGDGVKEAQKLVAELKDAKDLARQLDPVIGRLKKAHALLEIEGVSLPALDLPAAPGKTQAAKVPAKKASPTKKGGGPGRGGVSFVKEVAPILVSKCGRCHVNQTRGGLSMANFTSLERGNRDGKVIIPGKAAGSRIVEVIESGDMPRGGLTVAKEELTTLKKWIDEGAKFDGPTPGEPLVKLVPNVQQTEMPRLEVQTATGSESVQFSRDIAPILVKNCFDCHGPGRQDGGQLSLETFAGILRGGQSGVAISPGKPAESLIIRKLRGKAGARMPLRRDPLADSEIAKIEMWITEGAKYDAGDATQSLDFVVAMTRAKSSTHEQLSADRAALAQKNWRLAIPDDEPAKAETKNFLLLGNVGQDTLTKLGEVAEQQVAATVKMLRVPEDQPFVKGRITLFVFTRRPDYSEWKMVEGHEMPRDARGHWKYDIVDAYGCIVMPAAAEYSLSALVAEQAAAVYVASLGRVPAWFAGGSGRLMASRVDPRDARVRQWDSQLPQAASGAWSAGDFLAGKLPLEQQVLLNYAFVKTLAASAQKYQGLLISLRQGADFDQAFSRAFGATPQQAFAAWTGRPVAPNPPMRRGK